MPTTNLRNVYFQRSNGEFILLKENVGQKDVSFIISEFLKKHNYKSYYTRTWEEDGVKWYDVGSHTEFFCWTSEEDYNKMIAKMEKGNDSN